MRRARPCTPSPDVLSALNEIPGNQSADQSKYDFLQARRSAIRALTQRYPGDVFIQRAYIGDMSNSYPPDRLKVIAVYRALHDQRPDDSSISYLYGTALLGRDTPQAIKLFTAALGKAPNFPWPHLQFVSIYSAPNFLDKAKAISHAKSFLSACPSALEGYASLGGLGDKDFIHDAASQLRQIIQTRTDPGALGAYSTLWQLEFAAHPPSEYDGLRKQIAVDVAHLRALNLENVRQWWPALQEGYKLTNDEKQSNWAADESARRFPSNSSLPERTRWYADHDYPGSDAPADKRKNYYSDLLKQTDAWIKRRPNSYPIWFDRLQALDSLDDSPNAEVESCVAKMLALAQADKGPEPLDLGDERARARTCGMWRMRAKWAAGAAVNKMSAASWGGKGLAPQKPWFPTTSPLRKSLILREWPFFRFELVLAALRDKLPHRHRVGAAGLVGKRGKANGSYGRWTESPEFGPAVPKCAPGKTTHDHTGQGARGDPENDAGEAHQRDSLEHAQDGKRCGPQ